MGGWKAGGISENQSAFLWPRSEAGFGLNAAGRKDTSAGEGESTKDVLSSHQSLREPRHGMPLIGQMVEYTHRYKFDYIYITYIYIYNYIYA